EFPAGSGKDSPAPVVVLHEGRGWAAAHRRTIMKKTHLIASTVAAAGLICSATSQAGGLVGGFGGGLGGALNSGLGPNMGLMGGGAMSTAGEFSNRGLGGGLNGAGTFDTTASGLGRVDRAASRGTHTAGKDAGKAESTTKSDAHKAQDNTSATAV